LLVDKSVDRVPFQNSDEEEDEAPELVKGVEVVANGSEPKKPLHQQLPIQMSLEPPRKR
jgi:hypothetical protein